MSRTLAEIIEGNKDLDKRDSFVEEEFTLRDVSSDVKKIFQMKDYTPEDKDTIFTSFRNKVGDLGASAILGNIDIETGGSYDYMQKQYGGGPGRGLVQMEGKMLDAYEKYIKDNSLENSITNQIDFIDSALKTDKLYDIGAGNRKTLSEAFASGDINKATDAFLDIFERPKDPESTRERRRKSASEFFNKIKPKTKDYTVVPNDTLSGIAAKHNTTVKKLQEINNIENPNKISVGQTLNLFQEEKETHEVQPGETLSGIAEQHGTTSEKLQELNNIKDPNKIKAGQKLDLSFLNPFSVKSAYADTSTDISIRDIIKGRGKDTSKDVSIRDIIKGRAEGIDDTDVLEEKKEPFFSNKLKQVASKASAVYWGMERAALDTLSDVDLESMHGTTDKNKILKNQHRRMQVVKNMIFDNNIIDAFKIFGKSLSQLDDQTAAAALKMHLGAESASAIDKNWMHRIVSNARTDQDKFVKEIQEKYLDKEIVPGVPIKLTDVASLPQNIAYS
ncbi:MAG: phage tail tip lysozyme, partial [Nanoarchaeota archaeon]|nr:phage tail tip lysozyme [Nanoarchaeota archaeon]